MQYGVWVEEEEEIRSTENKRSKDNGLRIGTSVV